MANKCDRVTEGEVSTQEGASLAEELGCKFFEASAKTCVKVETVFFDVIRQLGPQKQQDHRHSSKGPPSKGDYSSSSSEEPHQGSGGERK